MNFSSLFSFPFLVGRTPSVVSVFAGNFFQFQVALTLVTQFILVASFPHRAAPFATSTKQSPMAQLVDEDELLRMALEASIHDMSGRKGGSVALSSNHTKRRMEIPRPDKHAPAGGPRSDGMVRQYNTCNQFHELFGPSIKEFSTAASTCGYMTVAYCRLITAYLRGGAAPGSSNTKMAKKIRTKADLDALVAHLRSEDFTEKELLPAVRGGAMVEPAQDYQQLMRLARWFGPGRFFVTTSNCDLLHAAAGAPEEAVQEIHG